MNQSTYNVVFKKSALKELQKLPQSAQQKVLDAVTLLAINPFTEILNIKKMKGADRLFRVRIQEYRVIYSIESKILKVIIVKIGHRREVYD